jgi:UDP-glucose 4-epimerase
MAERRSKKRLVRERVLVTSAASGLGRLICRRLHRSMDVLAVDRDDFPDRPKDVEHHALDLRRKGAIQLLKKRKPNVVVHISGIHASPERAQGTKLVDATVQLLSLVEQVKARKLVLVSSASLYGPSPTTASFLSEEAPLLGAGAAHDLADDISLDMMVQSFFWKQPHVETVILRPVHVVGPHLDNLASRYLKRRAAPVMLGFDPMIQIVHEDDLVSAIELSLKPGVRGVFNVTGPSSAPLSRLLAVRKSMPFPVPAPVFRAALERARALRLSAVDPGDLSFLRYSFLVDGERTKAALSFAPARSLTQTLVDLD